ncbi:hypothetical protein KEM63_07230 [Halopseudomonas nanhaiensis]|uniref:hypothetical protein n=1 Tax=Halopseudomonas nanhaiensis TaxID=2830842 RepID=UPI001CBF05B9|nr:hypothetical protein [Halopseudomonas nanhaiensis]UAW99748.1 hypothetical protein KEM63_07230 [Halopseudomonas nanhaiensis]
MKNRYKSRPRWLIERWVKARTDDLAEYWSTLRKQLVPADWPTRCARMRSVADANFSDWTPAPGSSSAELLLVLRALPLQERRWLAVLVDAPAAGAETLVEAIERLQLDWRARLDPLHTHRQYAQQLSTLAQELGLPSAAPAAYIENERKIMPRIDELLFESLPMRLRTVMANDMAPGQGGYLRWWYERLLAYGGAQQMGHGGAGENDWPDIPAAWLAFGWIALLRAHDGERMAPGK